MDGAPAGSGVLCPRFLSFTEATDLDKELSVILIYTRILFLRSCQVCFMFIFCYFIT